MRWQARRFSRSDLRNRKYAVAVEWHSKFAYLPVLMESEKYDEIVVPRHWLWLEKYERRATDYDYKVSWFGGQMYKVAKKWERRTFRGAPSLRAAIYAP